MHRSTSSAAHLPASIGTATARRLGERTCVVDLGADCCRPAAPAIDELTATAAVQGCRDFVFDLTHLRRYESAGLRDVADLWRRLVAFGCAVFVAARDPGVVGDLARMSPGAGWAVEASVADALRALLARPVET
jgi:hypothetical protein